MAIQKKRPAKKTRWPLTAWPAERLTPFLNEPECPARASYRVFVRHVHTKSQGHLRHGQGCRGVIGDERDIPPFNDGILISWGPINPYRLGLMSLSPIIWK